MMEEFVNKASSPNIPATIQTYEILLGGFAAAGKEEKVVATFDQIQKVGQKPTARGFALVIRGLLKNSLLNSSLEHITKMKCQGYYAPPFATELLLKVAVEQNRTEEILDVILGYGSFM